MKRFQVIIVLLVTGALISVASLVFANSMLPGAIFMLLLAVGMFVLAWRSEGFWKALWQTIVRLLTEW
jgi:hypothetical protein